MATEVMMKMSETLNYFNRSLPATNSQIGILATEQLGTGEDEIEIEECGRL